MKNTLKKEILASLLINLLVLIILFFGWVWGFSLEKIGLFISAGIYVLVIVLFFFLKKYGYKVHIVTLITSLATGVLIGSFISQYSKDVILVLKVMVIFAGLVFVVHGLLFLIPYYKTIVIIAIILLVPAIIVGFIMFKNVIAKELTLLAINYLFTLIGLLIYFNAGEELDVCLAGSLLWAFIIIFIIIIVILSEGDALSGLEGFDISPGKKNKVNK